MVLIMAGNLRERVPEAGREGGERIDRRPSLHHHDDEYQQHRQPNSSDLIDASPCPLPRSSLRCALLASE
jgi:hypothetical protein